MTSCLIGRLAKRGPTYLEQETFPAFHELVTLGGRGATPVRAQWCGCEVGYFSYSDRHFYETVGTKLFAIGVKNIFTLPYFVAANVDK